MRARFPNKRTPFKKDDRHSREKGSGVVSRRATAGVYATRQQIYERGSQSCLLSWLGGTPNFRRNAIVKLLRCLYPTK